MLCTHVCTSVCTAFFLAHRWAPYGFTAAVLTNLMESHSSHRTNNCISVMVFRKVEACSFSNLGLHKFMKYPQACLRWHWGSDFLGRTSLFTEKVSGNIFGNRFFSSWILLHVQEYLDLLYPFTSFLASTRPFGFSGLDCAHRKISGNIFRKTAAEAPITLHHNYCWNIKLIFSQSPDSCIFFHFCGVSVFWQLLSKRSHNPDMLLEKAHKFKNKGGMVLVFI